MSVVSRWPSATRIERRFDSKFRRKAGLNQAPLSTSSQGINVVLAGRQTAKQKRAGAIHRGAAVPVGTIGGHAFRQCDNGRVGGGLLLTVQNATGNDPPVRPTTICSSPVGSPSINDLRSEDRRL